MRFSGDRLSRDRSSRREAARHRTSLRAAGDWGIRIALGMHGVLVGVGITVGLGGFRFLASFLYGVGTADPLALAGATEVLLGEGLLAAYLPARRASRIDPAGVLREQ